MEIQNGNSENKFKIDFIHNKCTRRIKVNQVFLFIYFFFFLFGSNLQGTNCGNTGPTQVGQSNIWSFSSRNQEIRQHFKQTDRGI